MMKILHIEDSAEITDAIGRILNVKGYDYSSAGNGRKGIELILENNFDLILLDLTMPGYSGFDLLEDLQKKGYLKNNIIVITATTLSLEQIEYLKKSGAVSILLKPLSLQDLIKELQKFQQGFVMIK